MGCKDDNSKCGGKCGSAECVENGRYLMAGAVFTAAANIALQSGLSTALTYAAWQELRRDARFLMDLAQATCIERGVASPNEN